MPTQLSIGGAAFMLSNEGWYDHRCKDGYGKIGTDAVAGLSSVDRSGVITVGPGLTNALNDSAAKFKPIEAGVLFTADEIIRIWKAHTETAIKSMLKLNPKIGQLSLNVFDMSIDCYHSGIGFWKNAGWEKVTTAMDAATCCSKMPVTSKGSVLEGLVSRRRCESAICKNGRSDQTKNDTLKCDQYYKTSANLVSLLSRHFGENAGSYNADNSYTDNEQEQTTPPEPPPPPGTVLEDSWHNAYSNILDYGSDNADIKKVEHTRIYALFESAIVLDEMSKYVDFKSDSTPTMEEQAIKNVQSNNSNGASATSTTVSNNDSQTNNYLNDDEDYDVWLQQLLLWEQQNKPETL